MKKSPKEHAPTIPLKWTILAYLETFADRKLQRVLRFVEQVDDEPRRKQRLLSFAGSWQQLDEDVFERFTTELKRRRDHGG